MESISAPLSESKSPRRHCIVLCNHGVTGGYIRYFILYWRTLCRSSGTRTALNEMSPLPMLAQHSPRSAGTS